MRERTTWSRNQISKLAAQLRVAEDPRAMNQDHLAQQPAADAYEIGGPSDFGEDVHPSAGTWKAEYSGGEVKRNEIGQPEFRSNTFNHPEKTASQQEDEDQEDGDDEEDDDFLEKKADICLDLASRMLPKTASARMIEDQAVAFMYMPDAAIISTAKRLAAQQQQAQDSEEQKKQAQQQQTQDSEEQKKQAQQQQAQDSEEQKKQAQQQQDSEEQKKQAQQQQAQDSEEQKKQAQQQQQDSEEQQKQASGLALKACQAMANGDPVLAQQAVQQMVQQAMQQMQAQQPMQQQAQNQMPQFSQQLQQMVQQAMQQMQGQQQPAQQQSDDQILDQMLQQGQPVMASTTVNAMGIELEGASMDMGGDPRVASEDEALMALFASDPEVREASQALSLQGAGSMGRTAATRTIGTRPSGGVSTLGGGTSAPAGGEVDKLAGLWSSAPDVRGVFGS